MGIKGTTLRFSDERQRLLDQAAGIVASSPDDDPPRADVIDATLMHLIQSTEEKLREVTPSTTRLEESVEYQ